jgi:hypothetical protein
MQKNPKNKGPVAYERYSNYLSNVTGFTSFEFINLKKIAIWCAGVK